MDSDVTASFPETEVLKVPSTKKPEIPKLNCYRSEPEDSFWNIFPSKSLPEEPETMIDIAMFEKKVKEAGGHMTAPEARRADKVVKDLRTGAEHTKCFRCHPLGQQKQTVPLTMGTC